MENNVDSHTQPTKEHLKVLKEKFNLDGFKTEQWDAISAVINRGQDVFMCARSAYGKSLIYQYPPVFQGKKSLVISPLISLMETQVQKLENLGISACTVSGQQKGVGIQLDNYTVIYSTPENFKTIKGLFQFGKNKDDICLIAIDEAHCISRYSADHRPAYSFLKNVKESFPHIPIVALTSTASKETTSNICSVLNLNNPLMLCTLLDRPNIQYIATTQTTCFMKDVKKYLMDLPKKTAVIIYVFKRADTENFSQVLTREGFEARPYHSGLIEDIRKETLKDFMAGNLNFLVTTNAFGMGVDRSDVRLVIHYGLPKNPQTYYMESGRAGIDGKPSKSVIFLGEKDYKFHEYCFNENYKKKVVTNQSITHSRELLSKMNSYIATKKCRRATLLSFLEEIVPSIISDSCCDNCLQILLTRVGYKKMYREINEDGFVDVTQDIRKFIGLVHSYQGKCKNEMLVDFITGVKIPTEFNPKHPVAYFGCGTNRTRSWWLNILKVVREKRFAENHTVVTNTQNIFQMIAEIARDDFIRATSKGIKFLRNKTQKCLVYPTTEFFQSMTKTDIEYYIVNDVLMERPRGSSILGDSEVNEATAFDFSAVSNSLNKSSPRKRIASESEISDISLSEFFKSPLKDYEGPQKSPKMPKIDADDTEKCETANAGCSHWPESSNIKNNKEDVVIPRETRSSRKRNAAPINPPILKLLNGNFGMTAESRENTNKTKRDDI